MPAKVSLLRLVNFLCLWHCQRRMKILVLSVTQIYIWAIKYNLYLIKNKWVCNKKYHSYSNFIFSFLNDPERKINQAKWIDISLVFQGNKLIFSFPTNIFQSRPSHPFCVGWHLKKSKIAKLTLFSKVLIVSESLYSIDIGKGCLSPSRHKQDDILILIISFLPFVFMAIFARRTVSSKVKSLTSMLF